MRKLEVVPPAQVFSSEPPDFSSPAYRFLAEGDSWFSIGTLNPLMNSNLLFELVFQRSGIAVNCAAPGDTLKRMSQMNTDPNFIELLCGRAARRWDGLLLSGGGNDLIEAVSAPAVNTQGQPVPPELRLLLTASEWGPPELGAQRYLSDSGWLTFCTYLQANIDHLIALREQGPSAGQPIFMHSYAYPTPRPSGAGAGRGPWLLPSLQAYAIPQADGIVVAHELLARLAALLARMAADGERFPALHVFDSTAVAVDAALPGATGVSGDWLNEIHLTKAGYRKIARPWAAQIESVLNGV